MGTNTPTAGHPNQSTPPGRYTDPTSGRQRYWNGIHWDDADPAVDIPDRYDYSRNTRPRASTAPHFDIWGPQYPEPTRGQQVGRAVRNTAVGIWNLFAYLTWIIAALSILLLIFS